MPPSIRPKQVWGRGEGTGGLAAAQGWLHQGMLGRSVVSPLGIPALSGDPIGEVEPCFGNKEQARFIGNRRGPF
jgi:hypothetical protein